MVAATNFHRVIPRPAVYPQAISTSRRLSVENLVENYALQTKGDLASDASRHAANLRAAGGHLKINSKRAGQRPINRKLTACRRPKKSRDLVSNGQTEANLCPYPYGPVDLGREALSGLCAECTYLGIFDTLGRGVLTRRMCSSLLKGQKMTCSALPPAVTLCDAGSDRKLWENLCRLRLRGRDSVLRFPCSFA